MADRHSNIIMSVFSTTPGIGKTITAINLATGLASVGYRVCLVDLDLQFGDVMNYLQLSSNHTIAAAQRAYKENPDKFNIEDFLVEYRTGYFTLSILPPPLYIRDAYLIDVLTVESLISEKLVNFDFVVLDLNSVFSALNLAMLDLSTVINFVGVIDFLPALKNYKVGYDTLIRFEYEEKKIRLIENRADSQKLIQGSDVERLLGEKFFHRLPNDFPAASTSIKNGQPLMFSSPQSRLTKSFSELTELYTQNQGKSVQPPFVAGTQPSNGFLSRAFNAIFG